MKIEKLTNEQAHARLRTFHAICEEYNKNGLIDLSPGLLKVTQDSVADCLELIKFLRSKENNETTRAYMIFAGKILIRLSSLIHNQRKETPEEFARWIGIYANWKPEKEKGLG